MCFMKHSQKSMNTDPQAKTGNKKVRNGFRAAAAVAAVALAACSPNTSQDQPHAKSGRENTTSTVPAEQGTAKFKEAFPQNVQRTETNLTGRIIN